MKNDVVHIYTDGACKGNPGPGGWGAILHYNGNMKEINGYASDTTNNIMELTAVIKAINSLNRPCTIIITTDSTYVKNGITKWIHKWKNKNWITSQKKPVKNKKLWQELDEAIKQHEITWEWVKGHSGHPQNEKADALANEAIEKK